jgi:uncharacterized membrane protein YuzA (DUF378 family)
MTPSMHSFLAYVNLLTLFLVVVGALNWLLVGAFAFDAVAWAACSIGAPGLANVVYVLVGLSALVHIFSRDYYLPFLGQTAYPCGSLVAKTPDGATISVAVKVAPNVNVVYWAAEHANSNEIVKNPWMAYSEFANTGVAKADANGHAVLTVRKPTVYRVPPFGRKVSPHVHYRTCDSKGILGGIQTAVIAEDR